MTSQQIRQQFIDFFVKRHGHTFVPSSPVVPLDDPTLLFTNAGMNQFKPIFLGQEKRSYVRAANTQKCIRAGGKHNDLDDVGRSRRHHTFFEMLGNWSFGDYFKAGAIEMAWELLTQVWKLDPARLHVSCYEGDEKGGVPRDTEAADLWKRIAGLPDDHIHYFGKDNFWEMGETGPCGPCTEIHIDRTPNADGGKYVNGDNPDVMEIWNLVFIQYNRDAAGKLTTLPAQHVDTGMGLERICQVIQGKSDNFATDLWTPLFEKITELSHIQYGGKFPKTNAADPVAEAADEQLRHDIAFRVVADHARCLTFALTDGAVPSNEGRGYVLRRILRRAVFWGRQHLGISDSFIHRLVPVIVESMRGAFPELTKNPDHVAALIHEEEDSFGATIGQGTQTWWAYAGDALRRYAQRAAATNGPHILINQTKMWDPAAESRLTLRPDGLVSIRVVQADGQSSEVYRGRWDRITAENIRKICDRPPLILGEEAFKLHDTYGFPIDLTCIMAEERGMAVDTAGFEEYMLDAKRKSRVRHDDFDRRITNLTPSDLASLAELGIRQTDDQAKFGSEAIEARIVAIWDGIELIPNTQGGLRSDEQLAIILDRTSFYSEMGGQVGDRGELRTGENVFDVSRTQADGGYVLHIGRLKSGHITVGDTITVTVTGHRDRTEKNHTSTHLANWALREVLGDGVEQKGSLVDPEKLRFDFSHNKAMTDEEIGRVESLVKERIAKKLPVYADVAPQEGALKIRGLRAVFGEKYPPMVRVVSIGVPLKDLLADPANEGWREFSIEFCGGTHLANTADAEAFCLTAEESVSKGIRRIVALTGPSARETAEQGRQLEELLAQATTAADDHLSGLIAGIQKILAAGNLPLLVKRRAQATLNELFTRQKSWEKKNAARSAVDPAIAAGELLAKAADLGSGKLIVGSIAGTEDQLRQSVDWLKKKTASYAILLGATDGQKVFFVAAVSDDLIAKGLKAGDWVRQAAQAAGGGGGGRPQMAQAGGKDPAKLEEALEIARKAAKK